jgi:hypothetical protein
MCCCNRSDFRRRCRRDDDVFGDVFEGREYLNRMNVYDAQWDKRDIINVTCNCCCCNR